MEGGKEGGRLKLGGLTRSKRKRDEVGGRGVGVRKRGVGKEEKEEKGGGREGGGREKEED